MKLLTTFATDDTETLKDKGHFGDAECYLQYEITEDSFRFIEKFDNPKIAEIHHVKGGDPKKAKGMKQFLHGSNVLVSRQFGQNITRMLEKFVCVIIRTEQIEDAIAIVQQNFGRIIDEHNKDKRKPLIIKIDK